MRPSRSLLRDPNFLGHVTPPGDSGFNTRQVHIERFGAHPKLSDNAFAFNDAIEELIGDFTQSDQLTRGGDIIVPGGVGNYKIASTIGLSVATDFVCRLRIIGTGGRRGAVIEQTNAAVPVFQLKTSAGNIRDFSMENIRLRGGTYGLDIKDDAYCFFDNVVLTSQALAGIQIQNGGSALSEFRSCWWTNQTTPSECIVGGGGGIWLSNCVFGENVGGFVLNSTRMRMDSPIIHDATSYRTATIDEGKALFRLEGGSGVEIRGGVISVRSDVNTLIYHHRGRDILIDGTVLELNQCSALIGNQEAHAGTKPYPILVVRCPRVSSLNTAGVQLYRQLDSGGGHLTHCHQNALIDIGATEYKTTPPSFHADFLDVSKLNSGTARARLDQD